MKELLNQISEIEKKLHYRYHDPDLLALAFVHRSFWNENQDKIKDHNERLEFLGDSVLGLIVAEYLYKNLPHTPEGTLSDLRSRLVEASSCMHYIHKLEIENYLLLGKGEKMNIGKGRSSILADLFEAVIGSIYLDSDYDAVKQFFFYHFQEDVNAILAKPARNWKAELQDFAQKNYQQTPIYMVLEESGPPHQKKFRIAVLVNETPIGEGEGSSKKEAQQLAAANALTKLSIET